MWSRVTEIFFGIWMIVSLFIFSYPTFAIYIDVIAALLIILFALLSYRHRLRKIHLASFPISAWIIAEAYLLEDLGFHAAAQNAMIVGFFLIMITLLPSKSFHPPHPWKNFYK